MIGDKAQSIFSFQGASPDYFANFNLPQLKEYVIADNRRSTKEIVDLLNHIRRDIRQTNIRVDLGTRSHIFVGDLERSFNSSIDLVSGQNIATLAWDNMTSNAMKRRLDADLPTHNLVVELMNKDSNVDRRRAVVSSLTAVEFAREGRLKEAIKEMEKNFYSETDIHMKKKRALKSLLSLLAQYDNYRNQPFNNFYLLVRANVRREIANLVRGAAHTFYNEYSYGQLAVGVRNGEDYSLNRTIHKAKGDEFENVFLILKKETDLAFLIAPNLNLEQHRIFYVAASRARERLFINVPELSPQNENSLTAFFDITRL